MAEDVSIRGNGEVHDGVRVVDVTSPVEGRVGAIEDEVTTLDEEGDGECVIGAAEGIGLGEDAGSDSSGAFGSATSGSSCRRWEANMDGIPVSESTNTTMTINAKHIVQAFVRRKGELFGSSGSASTNIREEDVVVVTSSK
jgi:hypothetical protein